MDIQQMYHIMELALAKSELTGEYLMAKDVARAVRGEGLATYSLIEHYVIEIRAIVAEYGFVPHMVRLINGNYKPVEESPLKPRRKEAAAINAKIKAGLALTKKPVSTKQQEALFVPDAAANPPSKEGEAK
jgi:hypothetical protein